MTKVEYNAGLMRQAIKTLQSAHQELARQQPHVQQLTDVVCPGDAKETKAFHQKLTTVTIPHLIDQHNNEMKNLDDSIQALVAIDREYNNGELAAELGFKKINPQ